MGKSRQPTIQINGRTYDALTGKLVLKQQPTNPTTQSMDGFMQPAQPSAPTVATPVRATPSTPKPARTTASTRPAHSVHSAHTKKSVTLHRAAVKKPRVAAASHLSNSSNTQHHQVSTPRMERASTIQKSPAIAKFAPTAATVHSATSPSGNTAGQTSHNHEITAQPVQRPTTSQSELLSPKEKLIAEGLARAARIAQNKPADERISFIQRFQTWFSRSRNTSLLASSLAAMLVVGYVTYLNIPRVSLRVAAGRAGFEAVLPGYSPGGFAFSGPVAYSPGSLTLQYGSNTDDRNYTITQKETPWDSQTLKDNFVEQQTDLYATYQERGLIVYVYDGSNATWVNGGIWFTIDSEADLTSEQLLKIATSL